MNAQELVFYRTHYVFMCALLDHSYSIKAVFASNVAVADWKDYCGMYLMGGEL